MYERVAPLNHLLSDTPAQNIKVEYGKVAELTYWNEPYGTLRVEKLSNTGAHLPGAMVQVKHIESGVTYTAETNFAGYAIFDEIRPGAYEIKGNHCPLRLAEGRRHLYGFRGHRRNHDLFSREQGTARPADHQV